MSKKITIAAAAACCLAGVFLPGCGGDDTNTLSTELAEGAIEAKVAAGGKDVDVEMNTDDESFSMNVSGEDGGFSMMAGDKTELPENMPKDVPIYPGMKVQLVTAITEKEGLVVQGTSEDSIEKVVQFYKQQTADQGWTDAMSMNMAEGQQMLNYTKDGRVMNLVIMQQEEGTQIALTTAKD